MKIKSITVTNLGFSRSPDTLKKNLCPPFSKFQESKDAGRQWFGPVALALVEVEPDTGNELFWKIFSGEPRIGKGYLTPSDAPGLGIEVKRDAVEAYRIDN